ncbi:hypothetical protein BsWGS_12670 [Bradybaena similaris]
MRAVLGCTRDTPVSAMRYTLALSSMKTRHAHAQVKSMLNVASKTNHPLDASLHTRKGNRIKRGKSWMARAEETLQAVCKVSDIPIGDEWVGDEWVISPDKHKFNSVVIRLGRECRNWAKGVTKLEVQDIIDQTALSVDYVIYTDGSVCRGKRNGWGFVGYKEGRVCGERAGAYSTTTSSMRMEIEAATAALAWLTEQQDKRAVIVTDLQSMLKKIESGFLRREWADLLTVSNTEMFAWIYCPGHAGVLGNEQADRLAGEAPIQGGLKWDRGDLITALKEQSIREEEEAWRNDPHVNTMIKNGVKYGEGRTSTLSGRRLVTNNHATTGTISIHTLRWILERGEEQIWEWPYCIDTTLDKS